MAPLIVVTAINIVSVPLFYRFLGAELYALWKDFTKAPLWMEHVKSVIRLDDHRARWFPPDPAAGTLEWTTEVIEDIPNRSIAWRVLPNSDFNHDLNGKIEFNEIEPHRGTLVTLSIRYKMHTGQLHSGAALIIGQDPRRQMGENLRRFKMLMEAGEIATIQGQSHGPRKPKVKLRETLLGEDAARREASEFLSCSVSQHANPGLSVYSENSQKLKSEAIYVASDLTASGRKIRQSLQDVSAGRSSGVQVRIPHLSFRLRKRS